MLLSWLSLEQSSSLPVFHIIAWEGSSDQISTGDFLLQALSKPCPVQVPKQYRIYSITALNWLNSSLVQKWSSVAKVISCDTLYFILFNKVNTSIYIQYKWHNWIYEQLQARNTFLFYDSELGDTDLSFGWNIAIIHPIYLYLVYILL